MYTIIGYRYGTAKKTGRDYAKYWYVVQDQEMPGLIGDTCGEFYHIPDTDITVGSEVIVVRDERGYVESVMLRGRDF